MIRAEIFRNSDAVITGCRISGHANAGAYGSDIVCAAVSALCCTVASALQKLLKLELSGEMRDGRMEFHIPAAADDRAQLLFEALLLGLREIMIQYPDKIRIFEKRR